RVNGKLLLLPGLLLFAAGMGYIDWVARADAARWSFLPGLIAAGIGLGFTWVPVLTLATRDLKPELAGVASGLISTIQELGAVLQYRLAAALRTEALARSAAVPTSFRDAFVGSFAAAARSGLEVGSGQTGAALPIPPGVPVDVVARLHEIALAVFTNAYVEA